MKRPITVMTALVLALTACSNNDESVTQNTLLETTPNSTETTESLPDYYPGVGNRLLAEDNYQASLQPKLEEAGLSVTLEEAVSFCGFGTMAATKESFWVTLPGDPQQQQQAAEIIANDFCLPTVRDAYEAAPTN